MIEFRSPSKTGTSTFGTDCDPKQAKQNGNKVEDGIEFGEPSISVQSIPTTDTKRRHNYQTLPGCSTKIKVEDDVDIKLEDEMEFCALSEIEQSISEKEEEELNDQTNQDGFTEIKFEDEIEFGATSISVQSIPTIDGEPHSNQTIQDEFAETEDEMELCDEVEIDAFNTSETKAVEKSDEGGKKKSEITCDICLKKYSTNSALKRHRMRHGKPNFQCTVCDVAKFSKFELDLHMRTHDSKRIYFTCNICSREFTTKRSMVEHMKRHDNMS